jgi:tetratricopeptide (TPR) repeat protein
MDRLAGPGLVRRLLGAAILLASLPPLEAGASGTTPARPHPRRPPAEEETASGHLALDIRFDYEVVERFLGFVSQGGASADEVDRWVRLPGNQELLRQGRVERDLTPEVLKQAARATLDGRTFGGPPTLGAFAGTDWVLLRDIVASVRSRQDEIRTAATVALAPYLPPDVRLPPLVIHFHLGGSWDGRTSDSVYINLTIFQSRGPTSLPGLDALLVHELFHCAQAVLLPAIEDYSSRQAAIYTALLRIQQEGVARHIEYRYLADRAVGNDLDSTNFAKYQDGLRRAPESAALLARIVKSIEAGRLDRARLGVDEGLLSGGPLYSLGQAMAIAIEAQAGPGAIATTVSAGPLAFAKVYERCVGETGGISLLPDSMPALLSENLRGYGRDPVLAAQTRRRGLVLLMQGRNGEAIGALKEAVGLDPTDATSAYNLACAFALDGSRRRALRWLSESFDRGFDNYKHAATDTDLESLHGSPEFRRLLRSRGFEMPELLPGSAGGAGVSP